MVTTLIIFSSLLIVLSVLPFIQNQHWVFRVAEFIKLQLLFLQIVAIILCFIYLKDNPVLWYFQGVQILLFGYHIYTLFRYTKFWKTSKFKKTKNASDKIKVISCNIYQFNKEYQRFIDLINKEQPDVFLTMESNSDWEQAMRVLEKDYPNFQKVTLESNGRKCKKKIKRFVKVLCSNRLIIVAQTYNLSFLSNCLKQKPLLAFLI